jgi:hypothetical protein
MKSIEVVRRCVEALGIHCGYNSAHKWMLRHGHSLNPQSFYYHRQKLINWGKLSQRALLSGGLAGGAPSKQGKKTAVRHSATGSKNALMNSVCVEVSSPVQSPETLANPALASELLSEVAALVAKWGEVPIRSAVDLLSHLAK